MSLGLLGMGTAVPPYAMGQEDAARLAGALSASTRISLLTALYRRAGVRQRHSVLLQSPVGTDDERQSFYRTGVTADDRGPTTAKRMMQFRPWLTAWLRRQGLDLSQIRSWAVHPGGPRILTTTADAAGFDRAMLGPSEHVLANYGNMSSPTLLFILQHLRQSHEPRPAVLLAFGPGLTIEAGLKR